jgi:hypothetical protein
LLLLVWLLHLIQWLDKPHGSLMRREQQQQQERVWCPCLLQQWTVEKQPQPKGLAACAGW